jgi:hypothetical protein
MEHSLSPRWTTFPVIGQDLDFDMVRLLDIFFDVDGRVREARERL